MTAYIVTGLGFGDEAKGACVDHLCRTQDIGLVVRHNGGAQAAHNVTAPDGRHHTFSQFGSGTLVPGVRTHLSRYMLTEPIALMREEAHLRSLGVTDALERLTIDENALVITPFHRALGRIRELRRGDQAHGSCGMGIGDVMRDVCLGSGALLRCGELTRGEEYLRRRLSEIQEAKRFELNLQFDTDAMLGDAAHADALRAELSWLTVDDAVDWTARQFAEAARRLRVVGSDYLGEALRHEPGVVFEGAQGVLLDEHYGFYPYTTWSKTTSHNAQVLLAEAGYEGRLVRLGLTRTYATRHGYGPLPSEDRTLTGIDPCNAEGPWQGIFRAGALDLVLLRYAVKVNGGVDALVVSHLDQWGTRVPARVVTSYYTEHHGLFFFDDDRHPARQLRFTSTASRNYPAALMRLLFRADAVTVPLGTEEELIALLEAELGAPVWVVARGPSSRSRSYRYASGP